MMDNVFISGITGQDGIFLTHNLLKNNKSLKVYGTSRNVDKSFYKKLNYLDSNIDFSRVQILQADLTQHDTVNELLKFIKPTKVFNLSGPSSPSESFSKGKYFESTINTIFDNLLTVATSLNNDIVFFQPSSSETYSNLNKGPLDESSLMEPRSPYGYAKYKVYLKCLKFKKERGFDIRNGILFNHESEFRENKFLIMKIIDSAIKIKSGNLNKLELGSLEYIRDWSHASDVTNAMVKIAYDSFSTDYVVGTGTGHKIKDIVDIVFDYFNLNYEDHIEVNTYLLRPDDPISIVSEPLKIMTKLGWKPKISFEETILKCINFKVHERFKYEG